MNRIRFGMWAAMALILVPLAGAQSYSVTDLGTLPGGTYSIPSGINDHGAIVGNATVSGGEYHAFLWTSGQGMQDLGTLSGDSASYGQGINNSGEVAGASYSPAGTFRAIRWTKSGGMQDLDAGTNGFALGINNLGEIVGYTDFIPGTPQAFLWTTTGGAQDLGTLGGDLSTAYGINDLGQVVGYSGLLGDNTDHAFAWTQAGGMQDIDTLGGNTSTIAYAVNASGKIVEIAISPSGGQSAAFLRTQSHRMRILNAGPFSNAIGINAVGEIVGSVDSKPSNAFLWTASGVGENLNSLIPPNSGWVLNQAWGINRSGQIAAVGTIGGQTHAALLTPVH